DWVDRFARTLHGARAGLQAGGHALARYGQHAGDRLQKVVLEDVPVLYRVARPHVERAIVQTQVYVVEKGTEAGKVIHKAVVHDVPVMVETGVETARPYVQQAGQAIHKAVWHDVPVMYETARPYVEEAARAAHRAVAEEAPKAIEAVRPHVERAVTNAWHHTSSAVQTAGDVISQHAQTAAANVAIAAEAVQEQLFGSASSSSKSSRSSSPSPAIPEATPETKPEPPTRSETTVQVLTAPIEPGFRRKADAVLSTTSAADAVADRLPSQGAADGPADAHACPSRPGGVRDASTVVAASDKAIPLTPDGHAAPTYKKLTAPFRDLLEEDGYDAVFQKRPDDRKGDGCGIFWRREAFTAVGPCRALIYAQPANDRIALGQLLLHRSSSEHLLVLSSHLYWDQASGHQTSEAQELVELMEDMMKACALESGRRPAVVFCADLNSLPGSDAYKLITRKLCDASFGHAGGEYFQGSFSTLKPDVYWFAAPRGQRSEPPEWHWQEGRQEVIDYIFHSQDLTLETPVVLPRMPEVPDRPPKRHKPEGGLYGYWCGGWRFADSPVPGLEEHRRDYRWRPPRVNGELQLGIPN
ncbi:CCR4, partial [Symbiodinium sp. KB8]